MSRIKPYLKAMRPIQWAKNGFMFIPLIFDAKLTNLPALRMTVLGFIIFCLLYSGIYLFNDIIDREADRLHPKKSSRPIASGQIKVKSAWIVSITLVAGSLAAAALLKFEFFLTALIVVLINVLYTFWLKKIPLIDVLTIGILFVLRVIAGVILITVKVFSPWLYLMTFMLSLYLGFGKRRSELISLPETAGQTRVVLNGYTLDLLDQLITIVSSVTIMAYSLYTFSGPTLPGNNFMMLTIPIVAYGIFRYHYLIQIENAGGAPEDILLKDRPLRLTLITYGIAVLIGIYLI